MEETIGIIEELFTEDEDVVNELEETNVIEEPDADPSLPTEDEDTGEGGDASPVIVIDGDVVEPDEEDAINDEEDNDLTEPEIAVEAPEVEPIVSNEEVLPTIGNIEAGDRVMIALINGEATVLGTVGSGDKQQGEINTITADVAELGTVVAGKASIADLTAATGRISTLETDNISVKSRLDAAEGNITSLNANKADIGDLNAATARIGSLETNKVNVSDLQANYITANQIAAAYAKVDASNIDTATIRNAWIDELMVQSGLLAHSGTVYSLDAIEVNASKITAGTIDVQRLLVTVNNHKYLVQFDAQGTPTYTKLDGDVIGDLTITADKIVAGAITADKITTNNIVGTGGWINLRSGTFNYVNATSGDGLSWDGTNLTVTGSVTVNGGNVYTKTETDAAVDGAAAVATNFITDITDGIMVHNENDTDNGVNITDKVDIIRDSNSVASFGEDVRVGENSKSHIIIDDDGIIAKKFDGTPYFQVGLQTATITQKGTAYKNFVAEQSYANAYFSTQEEYIPLYSAIEDNSYIQVRAIITIEYSSKSDPHGRTFVSQYYRTFSFRKGTDYSWTDPNGNTSNAAPVYSVRYFSSNDRFYAQASGYYFDRKYPTSSYYFWRFKAIKIELTGDVTSPASSYAFGINIENDKTLSFGIGDGTIPSAYGVALGKYNVDDTNDKFALIVGNGTSSARSNAFSIDWNGNYMASGMAGVIQMFAGSVAPVGWLICDGSEVSRTTYKVLYDVIGDTFGAGDGSTTFNLPDFRGRIGVGVGESAATGHSAHTLGQMDGAETHTLTEAQLPNITGGFRVRKLQTSSGTDVALAHNPSGAFSSSGTLGTTNAYRAPTSVADVGSTGIHFEFGSGNAHNNMQPYLGINYIIATGITK